MKTRIKKNQGYLLRRPENNLCCFVLVTPQDILSLTPTQHNALEVLKNEGLDLFFIVKESVDSRGSGVSCLKFTSLEEAKGFYIVEEEAGVEEIFNAILYVYKTTKDLGLYTGYTFLETTELEYPLLESITQLKKLNPLELSNPVLKISRCPFEKLLKGWEKAETGDEEENTRWWRMIREIWASDTECHAHGLVPLMDFPENCKEELEYQRGMYYTHCTNTLLPLFRPYNFITFTGVLSDEGEEKNREYLKTFSLSDPFKDILASLIKEYGLGFLNRDPLQIDVTKEKV